jgi:drug/metabolite transporter (DMT)-like permease
MDPKMRALWVLGMLLCIDLLLSVTYLVTYEGSSSYLSGAFHLDHEKNIPSTYSALKLIFAGLAVFACISVDAKSRQRHSLLSRPQLWLVIGTILMLMGFDEYFTYHENLRSVLFDLEIMSPGETTIAGYAWPWTVYGGAFVLIVGVPVALFTRRAFSPHRNLFRLLLLAGAIFVIGALGFENLRVYSIHYQGAAVANLLVTLEETCEMVAVSLVIYVFLRYRGERLLELESVDESLAVPSLTREGAADSQS